MTALENVFAPLMVCAKSVITKLEFAAVSGIVYVRLATGAGLVNVTVFVTPSTIWLVVGLMMTALENVFAPLMVCAKSVMTKLELAAVSGIVYVRDAEGAGLVNVTVLVVPNVIWFVVLVITMDANVVPPPPGNTGLDVKVFTPLIVCARSVITKLELARVSGIVYVRLATGAGLVIVVVFVTPSTNWFVVGFMMTALENVFAPLMVCARSVITKLELAPVSGIV